MLGLLDEDGLIDGLGVGLGLEAAQTRLKLSKLTVVEDASLLAYTDKTAFSAVNVPLAVESEPKTVQLVPSAE